MKAKLQKISQGVGFLMLLFTPALGDVESFTLLGSWVIVSTVLLYLGKSFSFQKR